MIIINRLYVAIAGVVASMLWTTNVFAMAVFGGGGGKGGGHGGGGGGGHGGGGGGGGAPEIDGPGAVLTVALLVTIGIIVYRKWQK